MADNGATVSERTVTTEIVWHYLPEVPPKNERLLAVAHVTSTGKQKLAWDASYTLGKWYNWYHDRISGVYAWACRPTGAPPLPDEAQP